VRYRRPPNKYGNRKIKIDGILFDSKKEAGYYQELKLRKRAGDIQGFEMKPTIELQPGFTCNGKKIRAIKIVPDFVVYHDGLTEYVDVKGGNGTKTKDWLIKWKMLKYKFHHHPEYRFKIV
jgi:hypothetical protein